MATFRKSDIFISVTGDFIPGKNEYDSVKLSANNKYGFNFLFSVTFHPLYTHTLSPVAPSTRDKTASQCFTVNEASQSCTVRNTQDFIFEPTQLSGIYLKQNYNRAANGKISTARQE